MMGVGSLTWRQCDERILRGLMLRGPIVDVEIGYRCGIDYLTSREERRRSLDRLIADGLVRRREETVPGPQWPLLRRITRTVYEAVDPEGGDSHVAS